MPTQSGSYDFQAIKAAAAGASDYLFNVSGSVLFAQDGDTYGALANGNGSGSFDAVALTWSGGVPTVGAAVASFGSIATIGRSNNDIQITGSDVQLRSYGNTHVTLNKLGVWLYTQPALFLIFSKVYATSNISMPYNSGGTFSPVTLGGATEESFGTYASAEMNYKSSGGPSNCGYIWVERAGWYRLTLGARVFASSNFTAKVSLGIYDYLNTYKTRACQAADYVQNSPYFFTVTDIKYLQADDRIVFEAVSPSTSGGSIIGSSTERYTYMQVEYLGYSNA